jgi:hypothetical protein
MYQNIQSKFASVTPLLFYTVVKFVQAMRASFLRIQLEVIIPCTREFFIQGGGDGTACAVVNQLWAWLFQKRKLFFFALTANLFVD